jgi:hypothetical protein
MTPFPDVPNVLRFGYIYQVGSDAQAQNRLYWQYTGGAPSSSDCAILAQHAWNAWDLFLVGLFHPDTSLETVECTDLSGTSGGSGEYVTADPGTRSGGPLPAGAAALVGYTIPRRYRGGKPRTYWPMGTDTDLLTRQAWQTAFTAAVDTGMLDFRAYMNAGTSGSTALDAAVNVGYYTGTHATPSPTNPARYVNRPILRVTPFVDALGPATCRPNVASQRRRNLQRA